MSKNFQKLAFDMQGNIELIGEFFDSPNKVFDKYQIRTSERAAFRSRDLKALSKLGMSKMTAIGALSGAHSQLCKPHPWSDI